jgi:arginine repressor
MKINICSIIRNIIHRSPATQQEIIDKLKQKGIDRTQATVSRSLKKLNAVLLWKDGKQVWVLPQDAIKILRLGEYND